MKVAISFLTVCALIALFGSTALGQYSTSARFEPDGRYTFTATINTGFPGTPAVMTGAPYSGEEVAQTIQILADGTRVTRPQASVRVWRDSGGRTRTERPLMPVMTGSMTVENMPYFIEIFDPDAGYRYYVDSVNRVAHRCKLPANLPKIRLSSQNAVIGRSINVTRPGPNNSESTTESLGTKVVEGIPAEGTRTTTTYPIGAIGNDRPIVTTMEMWHSPDLNVTVFLKNVDPRSGENIHGLINISRAEPNPSLFEVPPDYQLADETGSFTVTITGHK